ncbi:MAG TPA: efflux RND transporter permease subunit [Micropepsaceae bacterium]|nr:efflux RND transporter permease subunit [Micropepsaceae bacterium]
MNLALWASHHRRSLIFALLVAALAGAVSALGLPVALFPQVSFPRIAITVDAGDQPANQMITLVTRPVEQAVKSVPGLLEVRSTTSRGTSEMALNFDWGTDMSSATLRVQAEISRLLPSLPQGTTFDIRQMNTNVFPVAAYSLTSNKLPLLKIREIAETELVPLLSSIKGVQRVEVLGSAPREVRVDVDPVKLSSLGLAMDDVVKALQGANVLQAVGLVQDRHKLLLTLADNQLKTAADVRNIVLRTQAPAGPNGAAPGPGGTIPLSSIARIYETEAPSYGIVTAEPWDANSNAAHKPAVGKPAIILQVKQQQDGNTVQIVNQIKSTLATYAPKLPKDLHISNWYDQSELIIGSANSVFEAVLIGVVLAGFVLLAFLRDVKITVITLIVVPAVLASTVLLLAVLGMSFNIMTLGGMAAAIGLIIDDAIVMIEQIERRLHSSGEKAREEIRAATWEFLKPLAGSSAATTIIFIPLAFLSGVTGAFFKSLALTLASSLVVSFLAAFFAIPLLADYFLTAKEHKDRSGPIFRRVLWGYRSIFQGMLRSPALLLPVLVGFLAVGYLAFTHVGSGFMPVMDEGGFVFDYIAPAGNSLQDTDKMLRQVELILSQTPEVQSYSRRTGLQLGGGLTEPNTGDIFIRLKPQPRRPIEEVMNDVRTRAQMAVPGLDIETAQLMEDLIGDLTAVPQPIEVQIFGDDPNVLLQVAPKVANAIQAVPGVTEIENGVVIAGDAFDIHVDAVRAGAEGLTPDAVTSQVNTYLTGTVATQLREVDRSIDVRVTIPENLRHTPADIRALRIEAPDGHYVPLSRVADVTLLTGLPEITRDNLKPMVAVTARIVGRDLGTTAADVKALLDKSDLFPAGTYYQLGGLYAQQQIAFRGLMIVLGAAVALVFFLLLYLYESVKTAIVIIAMPLSAMGAVFIGLWATGIELNISAMMGMTMIVGIVTEIAVFYFSEYELLTQEGMSHDRAVLEAGVNRFRPIAMTTIAAILALMPLAIGLGQGSAMQQPLAIAIISGLIVQMPLVLLVMPLAFWLWTRKASTHSAAEVPAFGAAKLPAE